MGAINYGTSNYITLGYNCNDIDYNEEDYNFYIEEDYNQIEALLNKYDFYYYHVVLKSGYYEGFYIDIENNFGLFYDCYEDKRAAQKEVTQLKKFLLDCVEFGLVRVIPGWCTSYYNYKESIEAVNEAIKEIREEIKTIPTYKNFKGW